MKVRFLLYLILATAIYLPAQAQSTNPASTAPPTAPLIAISPSHRQAAETLLGLSMTADSFQQTIDQMLAMQTKQNPAMKKLEPEMRSFFTKYMSWETLRPELISVYANEFTEPELGEIIKFYRTPVGRKMSTRLPQLMRASMEVSQRVMQAHLPELQQTIKEKMAADK